MKNKKGESYIFIILISGLSLLAVATFFDMLARAMNNNNIYFIIKSCFSIGGILYIVGIILWSNFTKKMINDLERIVLIDSLTGVLNRNGLIRIFDTMVNNKESFYIIVCDLDGTKKINDTLGHIEGDRFIYNTSQVLINIIGSHGHVSRFGGDEFVVILKHKELFEVEEYIFNIKEKIAALYLQDNFGISIGYCSFPLEGQSFEQLIRVADSRMYEDKEINKKYYSYLAQISVTLEE